MVVAQDGERMDRDYNGARGIYLRALGDIPALRAWLLGCAASANDSCLSGNMSMTAECPARKFLDGSTFIKEFLSGESVIARRPVCKTQRRRCPACAQKTTSVPSIAPQGALAGVEDS